MARLEALVCLNTVLDIGSIRLNKLLQYFDTPENILKAPIGALNSVSGIGEKIASKIKSLTQEDSEREFVLAKKCGVKIISFEDTAYPENLKHIPDPPIILYVKGELKQQDTFCLAIVGSRRASFYGLSSAQGFAFELSLRGFTIVSGMARGIDTYAHKGALKQGGRTIAVMGSGFNCIYPAENEELVGEIAHSGVVVSEFPMDTRPLRQNFPRRNRVISGLSLGVLVVEAAQNSGALITADFALEQGRDVFALPGKLDSHTSFGTNDLIKQGAKLVTCIDDIIEEYGLTPASGNELSAGTEQRVSVPRGPRQSLSSDELLVNELVAGQPLSLDEIIEKTHISVSKVSDTLLRLQMKKLIRQLPGKQFVRNQNER